MVCQQVTKITYKLIKILRLFILMMLLFMHYLKSKS